MNSNNNPYFIDPCMLYTPLGLAETLAVDVQWVKKNMIYNNSCRFRKQGAVYVILGKWVIEWASDDHDFPDKDK